MKNSSNLYDDREEELFLDFEKEKIRQIKLERKEFCESIVKYILAVLFYSSSIEH